LAENKFNYAKFKQCIDDFHTMLNQPAATATGGASLQMPEVPAFLQEKETIDSLKTKIKSLFECYRNQINHKTKIEEQMKITIEEINLMIENVEKNASNFETQPNPEGKPSGVVRTAITKHPSPEFGNYSSSDDQVKLTTPYHPERASGDGGATNRVVVKLTSESANAYKSTFMKSTKKQMEGQKHTQSTQALNKISSREDEDDIVEPEEEEEEE